MLSEADQRRFIMLLCARREIGDRLITDEEVAFRLRIGTDEAKRTRETLIASGLVVGEWELVEVLETTPERPMGHEWRVIRERIFARDDYTCRYCGARGGRLECDHVHPVSRGGSHEDDNLVTACFSCNRSKRDKLVSEWRAS